MFAMVPGKSVRKSAVTKKECPLDTDNHLREENYSDKGFDWMHRKSFQVKII
jgi:hypothetical protein